jgi:ribonuclease BN (tRNA processing enzyme)
MKKKSKNRIIFLGTGGGKNVMFTQFRKTGGIFIELDNTKLIIDPGPGSLVYSQKLKLNPGKLDGLLLSHLHPDHCTDADALLDGMKNPTLIAEEHCLKPMDGYYPCVSSYHQESSTTCIAKLGNAVKMKNLEIMINRADHYAPTVGFKIIGSKIIGYPADGTYYEGQEKNYENCDLLMLNILVPKGEATMPNKHMSVDEAIKLIKNIEKKPKLVVVQHFSFWMIRSNIWNQVKAIQEATGIRTIAAEDFMKIDLDTLKVIKLREE